MISARYIIFCTSAFLLLYVGSEASCGAWITSYGIARYQLSEDVAAWLTSLFWSSVTVGRLSGVLIAQYASPWTMLWGDMLGSIIGFILLLSLGSYVTVLWISTVIIGLSMATMYASSYSIPYLLKVPLTSKAAMILSVGAGIGDMGIPAFVGVMLGAFGTQYFVWIVGIIVTLTIPLAISLKIVGKQRENLTSTSPLSTSINSNDMKEELLQNEKIQLEETLEVTNDEYEKNNFEIIT
jgi:fucose permease